MMFESLDTNTIEEIRQTWLIHIRN